ncbi:MAG: UbiX family flavin prenyltransferase [Candidatus Melainabacteria bacterium]|nr:UbiX family flavin prenyltransferase [Candidatus Melainabacteria bacterium]
MNDLTDSNYLKFPITIAITGASGTIYGIRILQFLLENNYKVELVISESASKVALDELNVSLSLNPEILKEQVLSYLELKNNKKIQRVLLNTWAHNDIAASISSGSYRTLGMIIIPTSMGTLGAISSGTSDNLITRAADVCLKERRKLVLVPREMPFNTIHLENLLKLSKMGAIIAPASPAFYHKPKELIHLVDFVVGKALDLFGIEHSMFKRWKEESREPAIFQ